jgi:hypothetical protein
MPKITSNQTTGANQPNKPASKVTLSAGLAALDEEPAYYFYNFATNYFGTLADLQEAKEQDASEERIAYLEYFAYMWQGMVRAQAEKYGTVIAQSEQGRQMLAQLREDVVTFEVTRATLDGQD